MLAKVKHIIPVTRIQRERLLPIPGRLLARRGQNVSVSDIIAEADLAPEHILLNIARTLRVSVDEVGSYLDYKEGDDVAEGDVLAERSVGFSKLVSRAPKSGHIVAIRGGQVLLEVEGRPFQLRAGMPGEITELVAELGAFIETTGALIQGVWGNGRFDEGLMNVLCQAPYDTLTPDQLDVSMRGTVVLGGYCDNEGVFVNAGDIPLRGLILASMPAALLPAAARTRCPVIVLEGLGKLPMNEVAHKLLSTNERRQVVVNADMHHGRPEVVIPLPATPDMPPLNDVNTFRAGQRVRLACNPHMGQIGVVAEVLPGLSRLENGVRAPAAVVQLDKRSLVLPLANLEVLE
ncbi:MAG: hypothetical protein ACOYYS_27960 [Chloroflexota bacterium]